MSEDELNSLIAHAHARIDQLQKQLAKQVALEQERFQDAVRAQRDEDAKLAREGTEEEIRHLKNQFALEKEIMVSEATKLGLVSSSLLFLIPPFWLISFLSISRCIRQYKTKTNILFNWALSSLSCRLEFIC